MVFSGGCGTVDKFDRRRFCRGQGGDDGAFCYPVSVCKRKHSFGRCRTPGGVWVSVGGGCMFLGTVSPVKTQARRPKTDLVGFPQNDSGIGSIWIVAMAKIVANFRRSFRETLAGCRDMSTIEFGGGGIVERRT